MENDEEYAEGFEDWCHDIRMRFAKEQAAKYPDCGVCLSYVEQAIWHGVPHPHAWPCPAYLHGCKAWVHNHPDELCHACDKAARNEAFTAHKIN